jgi:hypothetical protein
VTVKSQWVRVSHREPCPVCEKPDWCQVTADGELAMCLRVADGAYKTKRDKVGSLFYLHRLTGERCRPRERAPRAPVGEAPRADDDTLHAVYQALLEQLELSPEHREDNRRRGLPDEQLDRLSYRTLPRQGRHKVARALHDRFGDVVLRVPGFVIKDGGRGRYLTLAASGLAVPVRDVRGRIVAVKVRNPDAGNRARWFWLSSSKHGGPGPGSPAHVPAGVTPGASLYRVTEGERKADICHLLSGVPTVSAPGATNWRPALEALLALEAKRVRLAYDRDAEDKAEVARGLAALNEALLAEGIAVEAEFWDPVHKGLDDLLAAGGFPEVLAGEEAQRFVAGVLAVATAGEEEPEEPEALGRLREVLDGGGPTALFADRALLDGLARQQTEDPAGHAATREYLRAAGVRLRELDKALKPEADRLRREVAGAGGERTYFVRDGRTYRNAPTQTGSVEVHLANFTAWIVEEVARDDGAEVTRELAIEGRLATGEELPRVRVPADAFSRMDWVTGAWGVAPVLAAGASAKDHMRAAIQELSDGVTRRAVYGHTGWREVNGAWAYLHAGGAIGSGGRIDGAECLPPLALSRYELPNPPEGEALARAVRASLRLFEGPGPSRIMFPLLAATYRAALAATDFAVFLFGPTGEGKTELAALCQQHFGAGLDARNLPANWSSTANSLEAIAFACKDALLVVDDLVPPGGSLHDRARWNREADRLFRAQGNQSGRQRMRHDGSLRPDRFPRGLILATGEDMPSGQSLRARVLFLEVGKGNVRKADLDAYQADAAAGLYAQAMAGFVRWLAGRYEETRADARRLYPQLRQKALAGGQHARTPGIVADLAVGLCLLIEFARQVGAVNGAEADTLGRQGWEALLAAAADQAEHAAEGEPASLFLRLALSALGSHNAHVADPRGRKPPRPESWGWQAQSYRTKGVGEDGPALEDDYRPSGERIGWVDGEHLYLDPDAAHKAVKKADQEGQLTASKQQLWRRLFERGKLASVDRRGGKVRYTVRRVLEGHERNVLHLHAEALSSTQESGQSGQSDRKSHEGNGFHLATPPEEVARGPSGMAVGPLFVKPTCLLGNGQAGRSALREWPDATPDLGNVSEPNGHSGHPAEGEGPGAQEEWGEV